MIGHYRCLPQGLARKFKADKLLFRQRNLRGAIVDEFQMFPEFTANAILSALPEAIFVGDWCQELPASLSGALAHHPWKHAWQMARAQPDALAPASKRPRAQGDAGPGDLREPMKRCEGLAPLAPESCII